MREQMVKKRERHCRVLGLCGMHQPGLDNWSLWLALLALVHGLPCSWFAFNTNQKE